MVTVVMPVYNGAQYFSETLKSILLQGKIISEIIVVNDGSTDGTEKLVRKWMEKVPRLRLINKENGGVSSARNLGLWEVKTKYVWFFDADDLMPEGAAEKIVGRLEETGADYGIGNCAYYHEPGHWISPTELYVPDQFWQEDRIDIFSWYESPGNKVFRTDFLKQNQLTFPNYKIGEDTCFCSKCVVKSKSIVSVSDCVELYRIYDGSSSHRYNLTVLDKLKAFAEIRKFLKKERMGSDWFVRQTYNELYHYRVVFLTLPLYSNARERRIIEQKFEEAYRKLDLNSLKRLKKLKERVDCDKYIRDVELILKIKAIYISQPVSWLFRMARSTKRALRKLRKLKKK
ncbi:MAG: glycosyltransferase family 2 protein [Eubacteriales bacterium]|nr:glycosyltransferase family 2 protein [Eubacteriales bacterium]